MTERKDDRSGYSDVPQGDLASSVVRGTVWAVGERWVRRALSALTFLVLARLLRPEDFGLVALAAVFIAIGEVLREQGLGAAIIQRTELSKSLLDTAFWLSLFFGLAVAIVNWFLAPVFGAILQEPRVSPILRVLGVSLVIGGLGQVPDALLRRRFQFKAIALRTTVANVAGGLVGISLAIGGAGAWALVGQSLTTAVVTSAVLWIVIDYRPGYSANTADARRIWGFGGRVAGEQFLGILQRRGDDLLIGAIIGPVALGYYTVAYRLLLILLDTTTRVVQTVSLPTLSRLQDDLPRMRRAFLQSTRLTALVGFPAFAGLGLLAYEFTVVLMGDQWLPSVSLMRVLAIAGAIQTVSLFYRVSIQALGRPDVSLKLAFGLTLAYGAAFSVGAAFGVFWVAVGYVSVTIVMQPVSLHVVKRALSLDIGSYVRGLLPSVIGCGVMAVSVIAVRALLTGSSPLTVLAVAVPVGVLTYTVVVAVIDRPVVEMIRQVRGRLQSGPQQATGETRG